MTRITLAGLKDSVWLPEFLAVHDRQKQELSTGCLVALKAACGMGELLP